jgi:hypothetical protein
MSSATYAARDINNALETIERDIRAANSLRRFITDYGAVLAITACYLYATAFRPSSSASEFLPMLVVLFSLHAVSEIRAQQRQKLLLSALRQMQQAIYREATSST